MTAYTQAERDEVAQQLRNYAPGGWSKNSVLGRAADMLAAQSTSPPLVDKLTSIIQEHLTGLYVCGRVWDAWNIGTMSESDFTPAGETDFASDIADSLAAMLAEALADQGL